MRVDIKFEDRQHALAFAVIYFPAIAKWLQSHGIECKTEVIKVFEWIECPVENYYAGGYGETVHKGRRYIFNNEDDAILFKLRWGYSQIDETDDVVQEYLTTLRRGVNQSVSRQQDSDY